ADRSESPLSCPFPRRWVLTSLRRGCAMRLMRNQPQGVVREPVSERGTAHMRDFREFPDTRAAFEHPDIETSQFDQLFAVGDRAEIANGSQDGRSGGLAAPGQWHEHLEVCPRRKHL